MVVVVVETVAKKQGVFRRTHNERIANGRAVLWSSEPYNRHVKRMGKPCYLCMDSFESASHTTSKGDRPVSPPAPSTLPLARAASASLTTISARPLNCRRPSARWFICTLICSVRRLWADAMRSNENSARFKKGEVYSE